MALYREEHQVIIARLVGTDLNIDCRLCRQKVRKENGFKIETRFREEGNLKVIQKYYHVSCFVTWVLEIKLKDNELNDFFKGFMKGHAIGLRAGKNKYEKI